MSLTAKQFVSLIQKYWLCLIGFALYCVMLRSPFFGSILDSGNTGVHDLRAALDVSTTLLGICFIVVGRFSRLSFNPKPAQIASVILFIASICLLGLVPQVIANYAPLLFMAIGMLALAFSFLTLVWIQTLRKIPDDELLPMLMIAFVLSLLSGLMDVITGAPNVLLALVISLLSILCSWLAWKSAPDTPADQTPLSSKSAHVTTMAGLLCLTVIICCSLLRGTGSGGGVGIGAVTYLRFITYALSAVAGIVFCMLGFRNKPLEKAALVISVSSLALVMIILILYAVPHIRVAPIVTSLNSALLVIVFCLLVQRVSHRSSNTSFTYGGVFLLINGALCIVAYTAIPLLYSYDSERASPLFLPIALVAALGVAIGICVIVLVQLRFQTKQLRGSMGDSTSSDIWYALIADPPEMTAKANKTDEERLAESVRIATERYGLTARESEIVALFAQGLSIKRTAEKLHLAPSTVHGYTRTIYVKLGIHSKEEIRDLLESI